MRAFVWPGVDEYAWPESLAAHISNGGRLEALEPWVQIWIGQLVREIERDGVETVRRATYTPLSGRSPRDKVRMVTAAHTGALAGASDRVRPDYERIAARETAFVRYEAELLGDPDLVVDVFAQLFPRLDKLVIALSLATPPPMRR